MRKSRFTEEQIVSVLKEREAGLPTGALCRQHGITEQTFYLPLEAEVRGPQERGRDAAQGS